MTDIKWLSEFTVPPDGKDGISGVKFEDSGEAVVMYVSLDEPKEHGGDGYFFIRLHSWDERAVPVAEKHRFFRSLMGRRVRITIETIDKQETDDVQS
jgi:hypothetical protein